LISNIFQHRTLVKIKTIFNDPGYTRNTNDQSVVEIVLARITAAIRETSSIETYAPALVDTLESCLSHSMTMTGPGGVQDTPHCKIASDLLSSLFLHYSKKSVMTVSVPTAIRALSTGSEELTRNTTSYLSLAAIHNGRLLAQYSIQIIINILNGNFPLVRVVPQIYPENREPFHAHLPQLLKLLQNTDTDQSERLSILQFASMVANAKPDLITGYLDELDPFLHFSSTRAAVLHIFLSLVSLNRTRALVPRLAALRSAASGTDCDNSLSMMAKVVGNVGRTDAETAHIAVNDLISMSKRLSESLPIILKEIEGVAECYPPAVQPHLPFIQSLPEARPATLAVCARIRGLCSDDVRVRNGLLNPSSNEEITVINVLNGNAQSQESLASKMSSSRADPPIISSGIRTTVNISDSGAEHSAHELDKNTENLANAYMSSRMRSSCSLTNQKSRSFASLNPYGFSLVILVLLNKFLLLKSRNFFSDNVTVVDTASRDSPLSIVSSHASRRIDASSFVPVCPPPSYHPPKGHTLPQATPPLIPTAVQIGRDGRVRPLAMQTRRNAPLWLPSSSAIVSYETTFPANSGPVTTKLASGSGSTIHVIEEEGAPPQEAHSTDTVGGDSQWTGTNDRGDVVRQFVDHRRSKIRNYVANLTKSYPIPVQCTVEGAKGTRHRMRVHFRCQMRDAHCVYNSDNLFAFKTRVAPIWLHLMFLQLEASSLESTGEVVAQSSEAFQTLSHCWSCLPTALTRNRPFVTLVTSAFPALKEQQQIYKELQDAHYFDSFSFSTLTQKWSCFSCSHPERVRSILRSDSPHLPVLEGQLKEKRGRWKFLKRWHTKYFTLSSAALTCRDRSLDPSTDKIICPSIDLRKIRSVKSLSKGRKSRKSLPRAFEIFTDDDISYVLKAKDQSKAEEWFQCLQIAVAQAHRERQSIAL
uniref:Protein melted-like protein n=1 Tax=Toxocara canis TaxID=6265 RepID=A0A183UNQ0_TOXCA